MDKRTISFTNKNSLMKKVFILITILATLVLSSFAMQNKEDQPSKRRPINTDGRDDEQTRREEAAMQTRQRMDSMLFGCVDTIPPSQADYHEPLEEAAFS